MRKKKPETEEKIFENRLINHRLKNHHTIETFKKVTNYETNEKNIAHIISPKYSNLSKGEQKALDNLQERDDIVFVNVN